MKTEITEIHAKQSEYNELRQKVIQNCKRLISEEKHQYSIGGKSFIHAIFKTKPYSPEEQQEISMYGDSEHEDYLMSEDYEDDCRREQYDWTKNEY